MAPVFLTRLASLLPGLLLAAAAALGLRKRTDVFAAFSAGAAGGFALLGRILASLVTLLPAVHMLRASGALDALSELLGPLLAWAGIPAETVPLMLVRPLSGSAALAVGAELMARCGPDSLVGRTAAVMLGSTETTFYVLSVYLGGDERCSRRVLPAALCADLAGFLAAAWAVRVFH